MDQLRDTPQQPDRQIATMLGVTHPTVATIRDELVSTGKINQLEMRQGKDGKSRKQPKPKSAKPKKSAFVSEADSAES